MGGGRPARLVDAHTDDYLNHPDEELDKDEDEEDPIEDEDEDEKDLLSFSPLRTSTSPAGVTNYLSNYIDDVEAWRDAGAIDQTFSFNGMQACALRHALLSLPHTGRRGQKRGNPKAARLRSRGRAIPDAGGTKG